MPKDLRFTIPDPTAPNALGGDAPSGILFPNFVRADRDYTPQLYGGIQKLVQQIAIEILTDTLPDTVGSNLARNLQEVNPDELELVARSGVTDLLQRILRYQEGYDLPLDERAVDLQFISLTINESTGQFRLSLRLVTAAGDAFVIAPPLV